MADQTKIQLKTKITDSSVAKPELDLGEPLFDSNTNRLHIGDKTETTIDDTNTFMPMQGKEDEYHITATKDEYKIEAKKVVVDGTFETTGEITFDDNVTVKGDILPGTNNTHSIGASDKTFKSIYSTEFVGQATSYRNTQTDKETSGTIAKAFADEVTNRNSAISTAINNLDSDSGKVTDGSFLTYVEIVDGKLDSTKTERTSNAKTADKVNQKLKINNKTFDGSVEVDVGTIAIKYGGTGADNAATARSKLGFNLGNLDINASADDINYVTDVLKNGNLILKPTSGDDEGGQIELCAKDNTYTNIIIDTAQGDLRIFGHSEAEEDNFGSVLRINPYDATIGVEEGDTEYTFNGKATKAINDGNGKSIVDTYATKADVDALIGGVSGDLSGLHYAGSDSVAGPANSVKTAVTFNNSGKGATSGTTFDGSTARTISYNTIGAASSGHTHNTTLAADTGTSAITLTHGGKYKLTAGGNSVIFTLPGDNNSYHTTGSWSGLTYTAAAQGGAEALAFTLPTGTSATTVALGNHTHSYAGSDSAGGPANSVKNAVTFDNTGSGADSGTTFDGSTARTVSYNTIGAASSRHTHTCSIATSSSTNELTLAHGSKYAITAGGDSFVFTMPSHSDQKVKVTTAPKTKAYLLGASSSKYTSGSTTDNVVADTGVYLSDTEGQLTAISFCATSDKRLKENLTPYVCEKSILELPVYKYNFIKDKAKTEHIGCLAQDLQEICPEIVCAEADGYLTINENKIVYLLLNEVKKLKQEVDNLKKG